MPPVRSRKFVLPPNYTFTPGGILIHEAALERTQKLVEKAKKRDPDVHGLYIYNDFFGYGVLELVDETLTPIHTHVVKKRYMDAWHALDALSQFTAMCDDWTQVDDGERVILTEQARGALIVTTVRGLELTGQLNEESIPNLEDSLEMMAGWAEMMADTLDTSYHVVLKSYGKKLFGKRTKEDRKRLLDAHRKAYKAFVRSLSAEERERRGDMIDTEGEDIDKDGEAQTNGSKVWFGNAKAKDADLQDSSFRVSPTWKAYRDYLSGCTRDPLCQPACWDLTAWTEKEKKRYKYGSRSLRI